MGVQKKSTFEKVGHERIFPVLRGGAQLVTFGSTLDCCVLSIGTSSV